MPGAMSTIVKPFADAINAGFFGKQAQGFDWKGWGETFTGWLGKGKGGPMPPGPI